MGEVGVVILHYRHWPEVTHTIRAVLDDGFDPGDVVVVDNASLDGSVEQLRDAFPDVTVLELDQNGGYASGMNAGVRALGTRDVLLLTHETVLAPGSAAALRARLAAGSTTGVVGPLILYKDAPDTVFSAGGRLNARMAISHRANGEPASAHLHDAPQVVDWLDGACLLLRREAFDAVGGFDEGYFLYYEESDFMVRAARHGWYAECEPAARVFQQPGVRPKVLWTRNRLRFLARNAPLRRVVRQALVDLRTVALGPDRLPTALGLLGFCLRVRPERLYAWSNAR
jgi:GT2 family glycosyltransferase